MRITLLSTFLFLSFALKAQTPNLHWAYNNNGKSFYEDRGQQIAIDSQGNIITVGYAQNHCTDLDIVVLKYNSAGDTLWRALYTGMGNYNDEDTPSDICLDATGNIYITGKSEFGSNTAMVTLKYSPSGTLQWANRYTTAIESFGNGIAVDASGNVYSAGSSGSFSDKDFILIKYNASGTQQWLKTYSIGSSDEAIDVVVDNTGNPVITGKTSTNGFSFNYTTIKYNSAGVQQWLADYNTPLGNYSDQPVKIKTDGSGNVYVTGFSNYSTINTRDIHTIKYDASGNVVWENNYTNPSIANDDFPYDMTTDGAGNCYIIGSTIGITGTGQDILVLKINSSGQLSWSAAIDSAASTDYPGSITLDPNGTTVYAAGHISTGPDPYLTRDWIAVSFDTSGQELNRIALDGPGGNFDVGLGIAAGPGGQVAMTGMFLMADELHANGETSTVLFNSTLQPQWTRYDNGSYLVDDQGSDMVADESGNTYVCGFSEGLISSYDDLIVFKVNASGQLVWEYRWTGIEETSDERGVAIAIDAQKNVYVTCKVDTSLSGNYNDIYTIKLSPNGQLLWENYYNGTAGGSDVPVGIAVDGSGNVFVAGTTASTGTGLDGVAICYDSNGTQLYATTYDGGGQSEYFLAMAIDNSSNLYAAGGFNPLSGAFTDGLLVKFNPAGTMEWDTTYDYGAGTGDRDFFNSIAIDNNQDIVVAGQSNFDFITAKYDPSGNQLWFDNYSYSTFTDSATTIATDADNNVIVGGNFGQFVASDFGVVKYNAAGVFQWSQKHSNSAGSDDMLNDMVIDDNGSIYLAGYETANFTTNYNFMVVKFDSAGTFKYELIWSEVAGVDPDYGKKIDLDSIGNIYIMGDGSDNCFGNIFINGFRWDIMVIRYGQGIFSGSEEFPLQKDELVVFPNPSSSVFNIRFPDSFLTNSKLQLDIFDITGRKCYSKDVSGLSGSTIDEAALHKGVFLVVLTGENGERKTCRMVRD